MYEDQGKSFIVKAPCCLIIHAPCVGYCYVGESVIALCGTVVAGRTQDIIRKEQLHIRVIRELTEVCA